MSDPWLPHEEEEDGHILTITTGKGDVKELNVDDVLLDKLKHIL